MVVAWLVSRQGDRWPPRAHGSHLAELIDHVKNHPPWGTLEHSDVAESQSDPSHPQPAILIAVEHSAVRCEPRG